MSIELDMYDRQQSAVGAEADRGISWFVISTGILKNKQRVIIRGDRKVEYEHVVQVMAAVQCAGILKVGFVTEPAR